MTAAPAASAALRILAHLARQQGPVGAGALSRALGLPRASTYRLLAVLEEEGFVLRFPEARAFGLGIAAFELGSGFSRQEPLARLGRHVLAALVDRTGESGHLAVLRGPEVVYLVEERAPRRPALVTDVGVRLPSHLTASGRALLAALPREQLRAVFPDAAAFVTRGDATPPTLSSLKHLLSLVRRDGYAVEDGEITPGLASVAVAVPDRTGWPAAAVALTYRSGGVGPAGPAGPADPADVRGVGGDGRFEELLTAVRDAAALLGARLFGTRPPPPGRGSPSP